jgi:hypothetical protein
VFISLSVNRDGAEGGIFYLHGVILECSPQGREQLATPILRAQWRLIPTNARRLLTFNVDSDNASCAFIADSLRSRAEPALTNLPVGFAPSGKIRNEKLPACRQMRLDCWQLY